MTVTREKQLLSEGLGAVSLGDPAVESEADRDLTISHQLHSALGHRRPPILIVDGTGSTQVLASLLGTGDILRD